MLRMLIIVLVSGTLGFSIAYIVSAYLGHTHESADRLGWWLGLTFTLIGSQLCK